MKSLILLFAVAATAAAQSNESIKVRVTGDRVSLRAAPGMEGELLDRTMRGDELAYLGETNGWVAVVPPEHLDLWVAKEFIGNGVVLPAKLNVRSGPNLNYSVVAVVAQGDPVTVRGEFQDWVKIAPPPQSKVWISSDFVEKVAPPVPEPVPEPEAAPVAVIEETHAAAAPVASAPAVAEEELPPLLLILDASKPQGQVEEIPGVLRRANPGLYKLVLIADGFEEPICLVRGQEPQLERYLNRSMLIKGPLYWAKDVDLPIIQPQKINLDPILKD